METSTKVACVGFIMDGNRRWAKDSGVPSLEGHTAGYETLKNIIETVHDAHIPHMVCYAFSTENWKRDPEEVSYLMELMHYALTELSTTLKGKGRSVRLRVIGERGRLPVSLREMIEKEEAVPREEATLTVWIAISYGGRAEILDAVNKAVAKGESLEEDSFRKLLWTDGMPDPDLIIRTGGEKRLSNFLLWQSTYSELFFTDTLWPDFGVEEFQSILVQYEKRERRNGT